MAEGGQYYHGDMLVLALDIPRYVESFIVSRTGHADDEVERNGRKLLQGFVAGGDLREARRITKGKGGVFIEYLFIDSPVIFQHEGIVRIGYQKDIENASRHEIGELRILEIELV